VIERSTPRWMLAELGVLVALLFNPWLVRRILGMDTLGDLGFYSIVLLEVAVAFGSLALVVRKRWWLRVSQALGLSWLLFALYATWATPPLGTQTERNERWFRYDVLGEYASMEDAGIVTRERVTLAPWLGKRGDLRTLEALVPPDAVLDTAVGVHPTITKLASGEVEFVIEASAAAGTVELLRESRSVRTQKDSRAFAWRPVSIDLGAYEGQRLALQFRKSYEPAEPAAGREVFDLTAANFMLWGAPKLRRRSVSSKNVVLISLDTLRADHLHSMGYTRETSPNIDGLAREGVTFESCYSQAPWTTPSHFSILTGTYPTTHGATAPYQVTTGAWNDHLPTLASLLSRAGYATAAFVGTGNMSAHLGFHKGFDLYDETVLDAGGSDIDAVTEKASHWIEEKSDRSFFLFVHSFEPHTPYTSRHFVEAEDLQDADPSRQNVALYDGDVRRGDEGVGRILGALRAGNLTENTIVVVTSDHGEEFDEGAGRTTVGSNFRHGHTLYDELMHVPLVIAGLGGRNPVKRVAAQVRSIDIVPTLLDYLGLGAPEQVEGLSLRPLIEGRSEASRPVFFEATTIGTERDGIRADSFKYVRRLSYGMLPLSEGAELTPLRELYDLNEDPLERHNIAEGELERVAAMERLIAELVPLKGQGRSSDRLRGRGDSVDPEVQAALKRLGYIE